MFNKMFAGMKGFRKQKKLTKGQLERKVKAQEFGEKYEALCREMHLQLMPVIKHEPDGSSRPDLVLSEYEPPQLKSWADASEENLKIAKACRHLNENGENCKHCTVRIADQDPSGTGVSEEYVKIKEQRIAEYRAKETEKPEVV